ncbi:MAG TPA: divalent-cation tolerance protein CutA [Spirochaetota bacterium]|nr:divalent-cation tolerance protein CutA [Spirochaetota bacterium]
MNKYIVVFCTVPSEETGHAIAESLVGKQFAACVNITGDIHSTYSWKGEVCRESERLLIIKSRPELFGDIEKEICTLHPYEVPEIISVPITQGFQPYLSWIDEMTGK